MVKQEIYIGLGSNLGDRLANIRKAIELMRREGIEIIDESSVYETEPVGYKEQGWFLNSVVKGRTELSPQGLWKRLEKIEKLMGREREIKWGPRIIDLDILFYENKILNDKQLRIPHSELHKRKFVLVPLEEIAPQLVHPVLKKTISQLLTDLKDNSQVKLLQRLDSPGLRPSGVSNSNLSGGINKRQIE
ncbi:2-amino-4-hydroxy-6-hydroxymethyldihydropteridine diphosphokinase [bacterium]|nr:2-amino-4-hydroxy-6-hydroxymethyldihydropteridine diphosphokinase [bacterium]NIN93309.1 2-amino-4-hydroxy-6-hydroxymethyldihydropteridine diphosphokinase [bacterium]NIO19104.1 2-amino-4-hydroxy-6-hydroxymethyldihydropteridine diphosphokinase [bacterium]NIO74235.1 2-amino-4-hydroxy-6-hydroxymethyldihydropteridine diphosphokinase [bacterium]